VLHINLQLRIKC